MPLLALRFLGREVFAVHLDFEDSPVYAEDDTASTSVGFGGGGELSDYR